MKRLMIFIISLGLFLIFTFCGKPAQKDSSQKKLENPPKIQKKGDEKSAQEKEAMDAVPVQVVKPQIGDISSFLLFSSNVDTEKIVDIYPMTSGIIEKIYKDEGDSVKKGTILAQLDDREAVIDEKRAKINYQQLKLEFERQKTIFEKEMISKEEHDKLKFRMQTAKLDWEQKKLLLSYTRITSPIDGVVSKRHIKIGNKIGTSQLSFSVIQDKEKIAVVNIPGQEREDIYIKQKSVILAGNKEIEASIKRISPAIDPQSGTFKVTVEILDKNNYLAVGQFVNVKIVKKVHRKVILLTKDALIYDGGKIFVFVINGKNRASKILIQTGFEDGTIIEVIKGLTKDDQVVTAGKSSLKNKTLVKIVKPVVS